MMTGLSDPWGLDLTSKEHSASISPDDLIIDETTCTAKLPMSYSKDLACGTAGFLLAGPPGALAGVLLGRTIRALKK